ncbi:hypothetical protein OAQ87_02710, partial [Candidatus Marinimicrobia bacterium]|nr:hypothetical protein [Candidatus Neomarinimicrobiota bacterium]
ADGELFNVSSRALLGFDIYRDNQMIDSVNSEVFTYLDLGLENGTQYCYYVVASYDEGYSQPTSITCASPDAGPMCPPENLLLNIQDGDTVIDLVWDFPNPNCEELQNDNHNNSNSRLNGYNIYRENIVIGWVPTEQNTFTDEDIMYGENYCYKVKALYDEGESNPSNEICGSIIDPADFSVISMESGLVQSGTEVSFSVELENQFDVAGFQFGLSDNPNFLSVVSISTTNRTEGFTVEYNEQPDGSVIIVGFNITGGSIGTGTGPILDVVFNAADVNEEVLVEVAITDFYLGDSLGGEIPLYANSGNITITLGPTTISQTLNMSPYQNNMVSLNVNPGYNTVSELLSVADILLVSNDNGDFYVPEFGVNQIDYFDPTEGFNCFLNGAGNQSLSLEGLPLDPYQDITLNAYTMNLLPFLMQECMSTDDVFAGYEDSILLVKNDADQFYVPIFGVQTMSQMCPGEAYAVFLNGGDDVDFTYPMGVALSSSHSDAYVNDYISRTKTGDVALTGESHLILLTEIAGEVSVGDQLRAYANDALVGSINIVEEHVNGTHPVDLAAVGSVDMSNYGGPVLDGYVSGDMIELRLMSLDRGVELKVDADLSDMQYGNVMELSTGSITVLNESAIVTSLELTQNYPNPFNPSTTISYNVDTSGMVSLKIYDIMGRLVRTLVDNHRSSGNVGGYSAVWDGKDSQGQQ